MRNWLKRTFSPKAPEDATADGMEAQRATHFIEFVLENQSERSIEVMGEPHADVIGLAPHEAVKVQVIDARSGDDFSIRYCEDLIVIFAQGNAIDVEFRVIEDLSCELDAQ